MESWVGKKCSGAATITGNKIRFSAVGSFGPIRLTRKFAFALLPLYPDQCISLGGAPLGEFLKNYIDISSLKEA